MGCLKSKHVDDLLEKVDPVWLVIHIHGRVKRVCELQTIFGQCKLRLVYLKNRHLVSQLNCFVILLWWRGCIFFVSWHFFSNPLSHNLTATSQGADVFEAFQLHIEIRLIRSGLLNSRRCSRVNLQCYAWRVHSQNSWQLSTFFSLRPRRLNQGFCGETAASPSVLLLFSWVLHL